MRFAARRLLRKEREARNVTLIRRRKLQVKGSELGISGRHRKSRSAATGVQRRWVGTKVGVRLLHSTGVTEPMLLGEFAKCFPGSLPVRSDSLPVTRRRDAMAEIPQ